MSMLTEQPLFFVPMPDVAVEGETLQSLIEASFFEESQENCDNPECSAQVQKTSTLKVSQHYNSIITPFVCFSGRLLMKESGYPIFQGFSLAS